VRKVDLFYVQHLIRESIVAVEYAIDDSDFISLMEVFKKKYGKEFVEETIKEIVSWKN